MNSQGFLDNLGFCEIYNEFSVLTYSSVFDWI